MISLLVEEALTARRSAQNQIGEVARLVGNPQNAIRRGCAIMRINVQLLTALNIAHSDSERLDVIDTLSGYLADGTIEFEVDGDAVIRFRLTEAGRKLVPALTLPWTGA